jgi:DNA excision repair protein ERCC-1
MNSTCALFVSIKYHTLHPSYIDHRLREVGDRNYRLRVLLTLVDDDNNANALLELNRLCFANNFCLVLAWSDVECARYLETIKDYEGKSSTVIQERVETDFLPKANKILTSVKSINKTDVTTLLDVFGNVKNIFNADEQQLVLVPGLGEKKVKRLHQAINTPFTKK